MSEQINWIAEHGFDADRRPKESLLSFGRCVYCGSAEPHLGEEHLWPDGLGGHLVLPRASCRNCERIIDRFEQSVIRVNFGLARIAHRIHSKKRRPINSRPNTIRAIRDGAPDVEIAPGPTSPQFVTVETPGRRASILTGKEYSASNLIRHLGAHNTNMIMPDGYKIPISKYRTGAFPRFLAKVAHCYACALIREVEFEPYLLGVIAGSESPSKSRYLGDLPRTAPIAHLNSLKVGRVRMPVYTLPGLPPIPAEIILVRMDIFSNLKLPTFEAVVGRIK